jgi:hypothetical protein
VGDRPAHALVGAPRQQVVLVLRGLDLAVAVLVDAVLEVRGDHRRAAGGAAVDDHEAAVEG